MSKKYSLIAPEIREIIYDADFEQKIRESFEDLHAYEVSTSLEGLTPQEIVLILKALGLPQNVEIFEEFDDEDKLDIFLCLSPDVRITFIEHMSNDERIDLLKKLPDTIRNQVYRRLSHSEQEDIRKLISYEEGSVGALVTSAYASVHETDTAEQALNHLRKHAPDKETIYYVYVIDGDDHLLGMLSLRELMMAPVDKIIKDVMNTDILKVNVQDPQEVAAKMMRDYDLLAVPAVDDEGCLVGIVTVDDLVDVVVEEDTQDMLHLGAAGKHMPYLSSSIFSAVRQRVVWLLILIGVGFLSGSVLARYGDILTTMLPLVFFIPMICASAGNAGTQSATVVIRELAMGGIDIKDFWLVLRKELIIGALIGVSLGGLGALRALCMQGDNAIALKMGLTVGGAMTIVIILSTSFGAILPIIFKKLNWDPALMSGPLIASLVDVCCLLTYMELAHLIFNM